MILSAACSWRFKIFVGAGRLPRDNIFVLKFQRARPEKERKKKPDAKWKRRARTVAILYPLTRNSGVYYLKRADSRAVNLEQEVRVPVDNAAIFMLCAEGIIYASARRERGVNSQRARSAEDLN